jgi:hypothetical protein
MVPKSNYLKSEIALQPAAIRKVLHRSPYSDANDRLRHLQYIKHISNITRQPVEEVTLLYEQVLTHLRSNARVQDFLPIFVSKRVTARIRQRPLAPHA